MNNLKLIILEQHVLPNVASASGIVAHGDSIYIIGDDVPWMYELNDDFTVKSRISFGSFTLHPDSVIAKLKKPDVEALADADKGVFWAFGSGSLPPQRDVLVKFFWNRSWQTNVYSLGPFYNYLRSRREFKSVKLNIEGAAIEGNNLFLLNRENNLIIKSRLPDVTAPPHTSRAQFSAEIYSVKLPNIQGIEAGFSGADIIPGTSLLLFTASVEATPNPIDDGTILGSFVGVINLNQLSAMSEPRIIPITKKEELLKIKAESIAVTRKTQENSAEALLVTDSDGGKSQIIKAKFMW